MEYKTLITEIIVCTEEDKDGVLSDHSTTISIEDEGGGAFIRLKQPLNPDSLENTISLNPEEIEPVMTEALSLFELYKKGTDST